MPFPPFKVATLSLLFVALAGAVRAEPPDDRAGTGDPAKGGVKLLAETCHECHGEDGNSLSSSYPKLAGQYADYLIKQIRDFKSGARENAVMTIMARGLSDAAFVDIAAHFAVSKPVPGEGRDNPRGRELFLNGDAGKGVPACVGCHGANGRGVVSGSVIYPAIGGQQVVYLREQLRNWRNGGRRNSAGGVMNEVAKPLTDDEIAALAEYVGSL